MYMTVLLTIGTTLYSRDLELSHLAWLNFMHIEKQIHIFPFPQPLATTVLVSASMRLTTVGATSFIMQYYSCCDWLIALSIMYSRFIHVVAYDKIFFAWLYNIPLSYTTYSLCIRPWWTFRLFSSLGYCEECCNGRVSSDISSRSSF